RSQPGSLWRASRWIDQDSCRCNARPSPTLSQMSVIRTPRGETPRDRLRPHHRCDCRWNRHTELTSGSAFTRKEKVELESAVAMYHRPAFVEPPPVPDLEKLFRRKVEMLEQGGCLIALY